MAAKDNALARTVYRALLNTVRSLDAPLRIRLPVDRSPSQWMRGTKQFGFVPHHSSACDLFGLAVGVADEPELSKNDLVAVIRAEFRRALQSPASLDQGLSAMRELNAQIDMARRSSCVCSEHAPTGAAVVVEATSNLLGRDGGDWFFQYRIRIANVGATPVQVLGRQWEIHNSDGTVQARVPRGSAGIVGQMPRLVPGGEAFEYSSGTLLTTPGGTIEGSLQMVSLPPDGEQQSFDAAVGKFECIVDKHDLE